MVETRRRFCSATTSIRFFLVSWNYCPYILRLDPLVYLKNTRPSILIRCFSRWTTRLVSSKSRISPMAVRFLLPSTYYSRYLSHIAASETRRCYHAFHQTHWWAYLFLAVHSGSLIYIYAGRVRKAERRFYSASGSYLELAFNTPELATCVPVARWHAFSKCYH